MKDASLRHGLRQFSRFLFVGAINSVATFALYQLLLLAAPYRVAFTLSFFAGIMFSMVASAHIVFGRRLHFVSAASFTIYYIISYGLSLLILTAAVDRIMVSPRIAPIVVLVIMVPINFLGSRLALRMGSRGLSV